MSTTEHITTRRIRHDGKLVEKNSIVLLNQDDAAHLVKHGAVLPVDAEALKQLKASQPHEMTKDDLIAFAKEKFGLTLIEDSGDELPAIELMNRPQLIQEAKARGLKLAGNVSNVDLVKAVIEARAVVVATVEEVAP
jgi:hypothetical protein